MEGEHEFRLAEDLLEAVLLDPRVADKEVAVVSVAGAFRKGKSFLLNFFLRFLQQLVGFFCLQKNSLKFFYNQM